MGSTHILSRHYQKTSGLSFTLYSVQQYCLKIASPGLNLTSEAAHRARPPNFVPGLRTSRTAQWQSEHVKLPYIAPLPFCVASGTRYLLWFSTEVCPPPFSCSPPQMEVCSGRGK
ncbi:UNVERIFIED_CONTAM: hypothetical protein K2H54_006676 [Gekko kuhli]